MFGDIRMLCDELGLMNPFALLMWRICRDQTAPRRAIAANLSAVNVSSLGERSLNPLPHNSSGDLHIRLQLLR